MLWAQPLKLILHLSIMPQVIHFSDAASIGIHSLIILAREQKALNAIQLSEKINASRHHIGKVLQRLVKDGFLTSSRGPTGGFKLKKDPESITLYDIYRSIEGEIEYGECPHDHQVCPVDKCIRDNIIRNLSIDFIKHLKTSFLKEYV